MKVIARISEDEMVAEFLKGEVMSERFSKDLAETCKELGVENKIIINPNTNDKVENDLRRRVLSKYRGWKEDRELFEDFPSDLLWHKAELTVDDLLNSKYVDYSYWNELSNNARLVREGAASVKAGKVVFDVSNDRFWRVAEAIESGTEMPPLILVQKGGQLEILEGHLRATAYCLANKLPSVIQGIVGKTN
ncbi:hypothetical protein KY386_00205 [Candidatus Parcubacteria bacterium]|nr:hypothetical protein [Candidatus Parcubacteria bacterium]